jgi:hypothetical protein
LSKLGEDMKSENEIEEFKKTIGQLIEIISDFTELSKRKPDVPVNKFKLGLVNIILEKINGILDEEDKPFVSFSLFSEDDLPTNSDILVILNQYHKCSRSFAEKNIIYESFVNYWIIGNKKSKLRIDLESLFGDKK